MLSHHELEKLNQEAQLKPDKNHLLLKSRLKIAAFILLPLVFISISSMMDGGSLQEVEGLWRLAACFILCVAFIIFMMARGVKYGLTFFDKKQRVPIACGIIASLFLQGAVHWYKEGLWNYLTLTVLSIVFLFYVYVYIKNIKQSNALFAIFYTFYL